MDSSTIPKLSHNHKGPDAGSMNKKKKEQENSKCELEFTKFLMSIQSKLFHPPTPFSRW